MKFLNTEKNKKDNRYSEGQRLFFFALITLIFVIFVVAFCLPGSGENVGGDKGLPGGFSDLFPKDVQEIEAVTFGIDVAKYQGTIDWKQVADGGVEFAMVRVGYRGMSSGAIEADFNAAYNLQEAQKYGIKLGAYFFSTAITEEEAVEEADWVADFLDVYPITYPIAYDCERFDEEDSRQFPLTVAQRTDIALAFLKRIEERGYQGMFYASRNDMQDNARWEITRIEETYKVWVAQYPQQPYPETESSSYTGPHNMWQYSADGAVAGVPQSVDLNIAYFGYDGIRKPKKDREPEVAAPDPEALMTFREADEMVTAKDVTNLRSIPSQDSGSKVLAQLENGTIVKRIGISDSGWSKLEMDGHIYYAVSNFLTTDLNFIPEDSDIKTVFTAVSDNVTAKKVVNLRSKPSVEDEASEIVGQLKHGEVLQRTGINKDVGWSQLVYNGQIVYCISSYLEILK